VTLLLAAAAAQQQPREPKNPFAPFDRGAFEAKAKGLGATAAMIETFAKNVDELGLARAADHLLRTAQPSFDSAVKLRESGDPAAALELAKVLAATEDTLLQAHARYHLAQVFLESDDPERAVEVLGDYMRHNANVSPLDGQALYSWAQSLAEIPQPEEALMAFRAFLEWFPDASERFRAAAHQRMIELERQQESRLHQLADGMKKTSRDLRRQKTDKPVQLDQERYIEELDELIEMFEQQENQSGGAPSGNQQSQNPASNSQLVEGDGSVGDLQNRATFADRWGEMRDADREKIAAAVQEGLPPQYRKMLEQYYEKLGRGTGNQ
jgi:tetratricopeptide (TPR) repeat protein